MIIVEKWPFKKITCGELFVVVVMGVYIKYNMSVYFKPFAAQRALSTK